MSFTPLANAHRAYTIAVSHHAGISLSAGSNGIFERPCHIYKPVKERVAGVTKVLQVFRRHVETGVEHTPQYW